MKRKAYLRLLTQLTAAIMVMTLTMGLFVYAYVNQILKQEQYDANMELLGQTQKMIELVMKETMQVASSLALNKDLQRAIWQPWIMKDDYPTLSNIHDLFRDKITSSNYIHSIFLYSAQNGKIISERGIETAQGSRFEEIVREFDKKGESSQWKDTRTIVNVDGRSENVISYILNVPMNEYVKTGMLVINLKEDLLYDAVVNINKGRYGQIALLNLDGLIISYKDKGMLYRPFAAFSEIPAESREGYSINRIEGISTFVSYIKSDLNGWRYLSLSPANEVFKKSNDVLKLTLTITVICLLLGVGLMYLVSGRHYSSIRKLVQSIERHFGGAVTHEGNRDEFSFISRSFEQVIEQNEQLKVSFQQNELILRDHFLLHLVFGKPMDSEELYRQLHYYKLDLNRTGFLVMVLRLHVGDLPATHTEQVRNVLYFQVHAVCEQVIQAYTKGIVLNPIQNNELAIILNEPEADVDVKVIAAQIKDSIHKQLKINSTIGIGGAYSDITEISMSYSEAIEALLHERIAGIGSILSLQDVIVNQWNKKSVLAYKEQTNSLIHELKAANAEKAKAMKDQIMEQLQADTSSSFSYKNMILTQIVHGIATTLLEVNGNMEEIFHRGYNIHHEFGKLTSLSQMSVWFDEVFDHTAAYIQHKRTNKNSDLIRQVTAYIEEHYAQPISLQEMADSIYMNPNYVSKLFKEVTGQNFLEYVTEFRFKQACQMLVESSEGIDAIAEACGFGHKQNLIRVFRKKLGQTPTEYRKLKAEQG